MSHMEEHLVRLVLTSTVFGFICGAMFMAALMLSK